MSPAQQKHITLGGIVVGLGLVGGLVAGAVDWGIKTSDRIGDTSERAAHRDSLFDARLSRLEKRAGIKQGKNGGHVKQEGVVKRIVRLFW